MSAIYGKGSPSGNPEDRPSATVEEEGRSLKSSSCNLRNVLKAVCILTFFALLAVTIWSLVTKGSNNRSDAPSTGKIQTDRVECKTKEGSIICTCTKKGHKWNGTHCAAGLGADGGWCDWHEQSQCDSTCGYGSQGIIRYCACPAPEANGAPCQGNSRLKRLCYGTSCPVMPPKCQYTFLDDYGTLASPRYPNSHPRAVECTYQIIAPRDERIVFQLNALDVESSERCLKESLRIYRKGISTALPVETLCSTLRNPTNYTSIGNMLLIKFRSAQSKDKGGFQASYRVTKKTSTLTNGGWCYWYAVSRCNATCGSGKQRFQRDCACPAPANGGKPCVGPTEQLHNCIGDQCVKLDSGTSTCTFEYELGKNSFCPWSQDRADDMDWIIFAGSTPAYGTGPTTDHTLRNKYGYYAYITSTGKTIGSKGRLLSRQREATERSCLSFWYHMSGSNIGKLSVKRKVGQAEVEIWSLQGNQNSAWWQARVPFSSVDRYKLVIEGVTRGYTGDIAVDDITLSEGSCPPPEPVACNQTFNASTGKLTSPHYPEYYPHNAKCYYRVTVRNGSAIQLRFSRFSLQSSPSCLNDYFKMYEGDTLKETLCGYSSKVLKTSGNEAVFVFKSDGSISSPGFTATYTESCGSVNLTGESGSFTSPNYPNKYKNYEYCEYWITVPEGRPIQLTFPVFQTERCCDYVNIYNIIQGRPIFAAKLAGSGKKSFKSTSNRILARFISDGSITYKGFVAYYTSSRVTNGSTSCLNSYQCSYTLNADVGNFTSPGYPNNYMNNECCHYNITAPVGKSVNIHFQDFDLEGGIGSRCDYDSVRIYEGERGNELLKSTFCGSGERNYTSRSNRVYIYFKTDGTFSKKGFFAVYNTTLDAPPHSKVNEPNCGMTKVAHTHVIGGIDAKRGAWPWQVGLYYYNRFTCGGSLIAPDWVLTAAHCVQSRYPYYFTVVVGDLHRFMNDTAERRHRVSLIKIHPQYSRPVINNDVALLKLQTHVVLNDHVNTVCIPNRTNVVAVGSSCHVTGWGKIQHPGSSHPMLQEAELNIIDSQVCEAMHRRRVGYPQMTKSMVCAGVEGSNASACHGDSGGPLVQRGIDNKFLLHGVVSWGSSRCSTNDTYSIFARVTEFSQWIKSTIFLN